MIKIEAKNENEGCNLSMKITGSPEDLAIEAVSIMQTIPRHLEETDKTLFFMFMAALTATGDFGVEVRNKEKKTDHEESAS